MTKDEIDELKEIIHLSMQGVNARNNADHSMLKLGVDNINLRLDKINGCVGRTKEQVQDIVIDRTRQTTKMKEFVENRAATCPKIGELNTLEDVQRENKAIKKWVAKSIIIGMGFFGIIITIIEILINIL